MRKINPFAGAAIGGAVMMLALVAVPELGLGETTTSHGTTPSDVYTSSEPETCAVVDPAGASTMLTEVDVRAMSNVLVSFTAESSGLDTDTELLVSFSVNDETGAFVTGTPFEWGFGNDPRTHDSGTVMWSFDGLRPGTYDVLVGARSDPVPGPRGGGEPTAFLENCSLSAIVVPVA